MKTKYFILPALMLSFSLTSCNDWLKEESPGTQDFDDFYTSGEVAVQAVNACYTPWLGNITIHISQSGSSET